MSTARPFRRLCPEADLRDAMTDDEYELHVSALLSPEPPFEEDFDPPEALALVAPPCPVCGSEGACGYDSEGRAMIHTTEGEPDD